MHEEAVQKTKAPVLSFLMTNLMACAEARPIDYAVQTRKRIGRSYELAAEGVLRFSRAVLCHGTITGLDGQPVGRAWLEIGGLIYDPEVDRHYSREAFCHKFGAVTLTRYSQDDAARLIFQEQHYGPWDVKAEGGDHD